MSFLNSHHISVQVALSFYVVCVSFGVSHYYLFFLFIHTVAIYPSAEGRCGAHGCVFQGRRTHGVATNVYWRKVSEKLERCGLRTLIVKGSGVFFTHEEGISTRRVHHKGRQPLTKCAISCLWFVLFSLFMFLCLFIPFVFFIFLWSTRVFPSLLRIPQLRWGN